ncbi:MAG: alanine racemase [Acidobacteria bacterium]|nr:MAG: alanine racemase [Acidobacteriota bacterium]
MSTARDLRPTWAEIDRGAFSRNVDSIARRLPRGSQLIAVLKGDAYGHGAVELAKLCTPDRVAMIATALLEESLELRRAGIELPLLVLGPLTESQIGIALDQRITMGVVGPEELELVCRVARARDVAIHLKLDTGMGRMGVTEAELPRVVEMIRSTPRLRVEALYTHFANADDSSDTLTDVQIEKFRAMSAALRAQRHHLANSAATMRGLIEPGDFVRVGIALFGAEVVGSRLDPVLRWRTEIMRLKDLPSGHGIGYGTTFHTLRPSRIATLPVGYADGYDRNLSNNAYVLVRGRRAPVVGRVSMDLLTIDVTDIPDARYGDEAILLGDEISVDELAKRAGTISYELFCRISKRVPRFYK